ncbi:MAG: hypothetical protein AAB551_02805 [Patescibacteria group bacterium]
MKTPEKIWDAPTAKTALKWAKRIAITGGYWAGIGWMITPLLRENTTLENLQNVLTVEGIQEKSNTTLLDIAEIQCTGSYTFIDSTDQGAIRIIEEAKRTVNEKRTAKNLPPATIEPKNVFFCKKKRNSGASYGRFDGIDFIVMDEGFTRKIKLEGMTQRLIRTENDSAKVTMVNSFGDEAKAVLEHEISHIGQKTNDWRCEATAEELGSLSGGEEYKNGRRWWSLLKECAKQEYGSENILFQQVYKDTEEKYDEKFVKKLLSRIDASEEERSVVSKILVGKRVATLMEETIKLLDRFPHWKKILKISDQDMDIMKAEFNSPSFKERLERQKQEAEGTKKENLKQIIGITGLLVLMALNGIAITKKIRNKRKAAAKKS